jgi:cardiolipin synthase
MLPNLPNLLTLSRIAAIPVLVALVVVQRPMADVAACAVFALAGFTDWLDGRIARAQQLHSDLGRMLDPIADKLLVGATLMVLAGMGRLNAYGALYPAIVIMCREILVSGLREYLATLSVGLPVTRLAKWKTGLQMVALGTMLAGDTGASTLHVATLPVGLIGTCMLWAAAILTLITGWDYLMAGLRHAVPAFSTPAPPPHGPATPPVERLTTKAVPR